MNHDLLLKTEAPVIAIPSSKNQPVPTELEGNDTQVFSSELGKQIDKQSPVQDEVDVASLQTNPKATTASSEEKAEISIEESGKLLPLEAEVADEFVAQLLSDFEGSVELKQELTTTIENFVKRILDDENPDLDIENEVNQLLVQLAALIEAGKQAQTPVTKSNNASQETVSPNLARLLNSINPNKGQLEQSTVVTSSQQVTATTVGTALSNPVAEAEINTKAPVSKTEQIDPEKAFKAEQQQVQSVLQKLNETVKQSVQGIDKPESDKVVRVTELVKQIVPLTDSAKRDVTPIVVETTQVQQTLKQAPLRPDILQALSAKPVQAEGDLAKQAFTEQVLKSTPNTDRVLTELKGIEQQVTSDTRAQRMAQLIDLLKPASVDDQPTKSLGTDKPVSTVTTSSTPSLLQSSSVAKGAPSLDIQPAIQSAAWNRVLTSRVVWLASEGIQQAALKLNPANLGPVEVRLHVQNEQTSVTFIAHHATTREALEQALPRLRESFTENGMSLADANVSDQTSQQANDQENKDDNNKNEIQSTDLAVKKEDDSSNSEISARDNEQETALGVNVFA